MPTGTVINYGAVVVGGLAKDGGRGERRGYTCCKTEGKATRQRTPKTAQNKAVSFRGRRACVAPQTSRRNAVAFSPRGIWCTVMSFEPLLGTPRQPELAAG